MSTNGFGIRPLRLTPLAGCLVAALAFTAGANAAGLAPRIPTAVAPLPDRGAEAREPAGGWRPSDPSDIALRWRPAPHARPSIPANSIVVQNCNDSGSGSLRDALAQAGNGDTIDLTQLSCSTITLTTGSIQVAQTTVSLRGPGFAALSLDGNGAYPFLLHVGTGTVYINDVTVEHGVNDAAVINARGGCIYSAGSVFLTNSMLNDCASTNTTTTHGAEGGAVYGRVGVTLSNSGVVNSFVFAPSSYGLGGAVYSHGFVNLEHSFIRGNYASLWSGGVYAGNGASISYSTIDGNHAGHYYGGLFASGNITIANSTISNNQAIVGTGGAGLAAYRATSPIAIVNSTISGNRAGAIGGLKISEYDARVSNTTIAFNYELSATAYGAGLHIEGVNVDLESTILSNNTQTGASIPDDVGGTASATITGANNLIESSTITTPGDTILFQSALLGPLAYNGGTTRTHRIMGGSPAIDTGNNVANLSYDQRGPGYVRVVGSSADIGAYELNTDDVIFVNGFDP